MAPSHYLDQCWIIVNWTLGNRLQWNLNWNSSIFIQENTFESVVCEMAAILSRPQCVNPFRSEQNGQCFTDDNFNCIFMNGTFLWKQLTWLPCSQYHKYVSTEYIMYSAHTTNYIIRYRDALSTLMLFVEFIFQQTIPWHGITLVHIMYSHSKFNCNTYVIVLHLVPELANNNKI